MAERLRGGQDELPASQRWQDRLPKYGPEKAFDGTFKEQNATAKIVSGSKNTRWKVCFRLAHLTPTIGLSNLETITSTALWVSPITSGSGFSRVRRIWTQICKRICERLVGHGYRPERIEWTKHSEDPSVYVKPEQKKRGGSVEPVVRGPFSLTSCRFRPT